MSQETVLAMMQDAIMTVIKVSAPPLVVAVVIGLIVSIFQATTQINEQTLAFVPKIVGVFLTLIIFGPWMLTQLTELFARLMEFTIIAYGAGFLVWA